MIVDAKETLKAKALPSALWSQAIWHVVWIKNCVPSQSLNLETTPYQEYFSKKPNLATLHLFGCKAYAHTPKVNQTKFGECTIECVHIGFAQEKKEYLLYNRERCQLIESCNVEFEEIDVREHVTVELERDNYGNPEGGQRRVQTIMLMFPIHLHNRLHPHQPFPPL